MEKWEYCAMTMRENQTYIFFPDGSAKTQEGISAYDLNKKFGDKNLMREGGYFTFVAMLNSMGAEGWEVVGCITNNTGHGHVILKRAAP
jgi:hypothetical protein